jgi:hypothetical protein
MRTCRSQRELAHVVREELAAADVFAQRVLEEEQEDDGEDEPRHHVTDPVDDGFDRVGKPLERIQQHGIGVRRLSLHCLRQIENMGSRQKKDGLFNPNKKK